MNIILCPIKVNTSTIELTVHTSCYCILDLLCVSIISLYFFTSFQQSLISSIFTFVNLLRVIKLLDRKLCYVLFNNCHSVVFMIMLHLGYISPTPIKDIIDGFKPRYYTASVANFDLVF